MKKVYTIIEKCLACRSCELACAVKHSSGRTLLSALREGGLAKPRIRVFARDKLRIPINCQHCDTPRCLDACMTGAMHRDEATGAVVCDTERCVGCWMCVMVCPFGAVRNQPDGAVALKCDLCTDETEPACVKACPTGARVVGELGEILELATTGGEEK